MAEPDVRPPGAASPSGKSIKIVEIPLTAMAGRMKNFSENIYPIRNSLKFSQILSFHDYFFFGGGTPSRFGCALAGLGQSVARVKI